MIRLILKYREFKETFNGENYTIDFSLSPIRNDIVFKIRSRDKSYLNFTVVREYTLVKNNDIYGYQPYFDIDDYTILCKLDDHVLAQYKKDDDYIKVGSMDSYGNEFLIVSDEDSDLEIKSSVVLNFILDSKLFKDEFEKAVLQII